jgi:hypothetical protein
MNLSHIFPPACEREPLDPIIADLNLARVLILILEIPKKRGRGSSG